MDVELLTSPIDKHIATFMASLDVTDWPLAIVIWEIQECDWGISLCCIRYHIETLLCRFGFHNSKPVATLM